MWRKENPLTLWAGMSVGAATTESPSKTKDRVTTRSQNPTPRQKHNLKRYMSLHIESSTTHNRQDMKTTKMSIQRWMDKEDVVKIHSGILLNHKKNEMLTLGKSEGERQITYNVTYMWNLKYETSELLCNRSRITDREWTCGAWR